VEEAMNISQSKDMIALTICKQNLHCVPEHVIHVHMGTKQWRVMKDRESSEFITIVKWQLYDGGSICMGLSNDMNTLVIADTEL
jgi:hypothetical protein